MAQQNQVFAWTAYANPCMMAEALSCRCRTVGRGVSTASRGVYNLRIGDAMDGAVASSVLCDTPTCYSRRDGAEEGGRIYANPDGTRSCVD